MHAIHEVDGLLDELVHVGIVLYERNKLAVGSHKVLDERGGFQRATELERLCGVEELDAENLLHVVDH